MTPFEIAYLTLPLVLLVLVGGPGWLAIRYMRRHRDTAPPAE